jgi:hypothetical protein
MKTCGFRPCIRCHSHKSQGCGIDQSRVREFKPTDWRGDAAQLNAMLIIMNKAPNSQQRRKLRAQLEVEPL